MFVLTERCKGCGLCIEFCSNHVLKESTDFNKKGYLYVYVDDATKCDDCGLCQDICPDFAIYVPGRVDDGTSTEKAIGLFVCHCGINIASKVDIEKIKEEMENYPGVAYVRDYKYMCSQPGQAMVTECIKENNLDGLVVAACSPSLHEATFRNVSRKAGINPYQCEIANIREHCSWVHDDKEEATDKASHIVSSIVEKVKLNESLTPIGVPITRRAMVIGAGIAGIQAALDTADGGYDVLLVERDPSIGGRMAQLSSTFPKMNSALDALAPMMEEVTKHPRIKLLTYNEIEEVSGYVGNFVVKLKSKAAYVDRARCTSCRKCMEVCPAEAPSEFDRGLVQRKAIYIPFEKAVPCTAVIDKESCLHFGSEECSKCAEVCPENVIDFEQTDVYHEEEVGAIIVATGYDLYPKTKLEEYGAGKCPDVIDGLQFERLCSPTGPTGGEIRRPSDGKVPKKVVFVQCAGSRDPEHAMPYCSKVCCMYTPKHAMLYKEQVPDGQPFIFYIDVRTAGKDYEEFVQEGTERDGIRYLRGKVSKIFREGEKVVVWGSDTLVGKKVEVDADLVVLSTAMVPHTSARDLIGKLRIASDQDGFFNEAHPKLKPVESLTAGYFLAGCTHGPRDIPEAIAQASGAACKVLSLFSEEQLSHDPIVVKVEADACRGCGLCVMACPYEARSLDGPGGIAEVNEILCQGCGACVVACPNGASRQHNFDISQILTMIEALI